MPRCFAARRALEGEAGGIGAGFARDEDGAGALAPDFELIDGGGAERVAGRQHDLAALGAEFRGELADGRGLAGAVDAGDQDDERLCAGSIASGSATGASTFSISAASTALTSSGEIALS